MSFLDNLSSYAVIVSSSGNATVKHYPTNTMIHSPINPVKEANDVAESHCLEVEGGILLIGGGLGYLAEALQRKYKIKIIVIEPHADLYALAKYARSLSEYTCLSQIKTYCCSTSTSALEVLKRHNEISKVIIAPYLFNEHILNDNKLSALIQLIRSLCASKNTYINSVSANKSDKGLFNTVFYPLNEAFLPTDKICVVCGAGPSLTEAIPVIKSERDKISLIAVSGAVPSLTASNIHPDWVVALEAKNSVVEDLQNLVQTTNIITFSTTNHNLYKLNNHKFFVGDNNDEVVLETWGGTTVTPAIDFALKYSKSAIIIAGVDLSNQYGEYAENSKRDSNTDDLNYSPPKFTAMRYGINRVLEKHSLTNGKRDIYHFTKSSKKLNTTTHLNITDMKAILERRLQGFNYAE